MQKHLIAEKSISDTVRFNFQTNMSICGCGRVVKDVCDWCGVYQRCEFESCRGRTKKLSDQKSNSNTVGFDFQMYIYMGYIVNPKYPIICLMFSFQI
jgi:hypothetical protein